MQIKHIHYKQTLINVNYLHKVKFLIDALEKKKFIREIKIVLRVQNFNLERSFSKSVKLFFFSDITNSSFISSTLEKI